jgi:hypothetical protein
MRYISTVSERFRGAFGKTLQINGILLGAMSETTYAK